MKNILIFLVIFSTFSRGNAQVVFQKAYGAAAPERNLLTALLITSDGGYIMTGRKNIAVPGNQDIFLIKTNFLGDTVWTKIFGGSAEDYASSVKQTNDGGYIIVGSTYSFGGNTEAYLIKTDSVGNLEWSTTYGSADFDGGNSIEQTPDGGYILLGGTNTFVNGSWLLKLDSVGNIIWTKIFSQTSPCSILLAKDNGYIILGSINDSLTAYRDICMIKTDSIGDILWVKSFSDSMANLTEASFQQTEDGDFVIVGTHAYPSVYGEKMLIKTDSVGDFLWCRLYDQQYGATVKETTDKGFIISGTTGDLGTNLTDGCLIKTDSIGNIEWSKSYGAENYDYGFAAEQTIDGGFVLAGSIGITSGMYVYESFYLTKTDSSGNSSCNQSNLVINDSIIILSEKSPVINVFSWGASDIPATQTSSGCVVINLCTVGISEASTFSKVNVYPNPFSNFTVLEFSNLQKDNCTLTLIDCQGRLVRTIKNITTDKVEIERQNLASGLYFFQLLTDRQIIATGKLTIE